MSATERRLWRRAKLRCRFGYAWQLFTEGREHVLDAGIAQLLPAGTSAASPRGGAGVGYVSVDTRRPPLQIEPSRSRVDERRCSTSAKEHLRSS